MTSAQSVPTIVAFQWVPEFAQGLVRDIRVRWALQEAGRSYQVRQITRDDQTTPAYRALQPFGQVPAYEEGALILFESGAILHHIASSSPALMPDDPAERARTVTWMFAALNSVEPYVTSLNEIDLFSGGAAWGQERRPAVVARLEKRLAELQDALGDGPYLVGRFTVADILMATVLRTLRHTDIVARFPALNAYLDRCNARPAARESLKEQLASFVAPQA